MKRDKRPILFCVAVSVFGCGGNDVERRPPVRESIDGIPVVRNYSAQWSSGESWRFQETFRVGDQEDDYLAGPPALAFGPDGLLAILDTEADDVRVYGREGALLTRFGRQGQGPGEFRAPFAMGWDGAGRLWVANAFDGRFNVFDPEGEFVKSVPRPIHGRNALISRLVFSEDGASFWDELNRPAGAPAPLLIDTAGVLVDSTPTIPHDPFPGGAGAVPLRPGTAFRRLADLNFLPRTRWAIHPSGLRWSTMVGDTRIIQTDPLGDTLLIASREYAAREISGRWQRLVAEGEQEGADPAWFARPLVQTVAVTSDGFVLVAVVDEPHLGSNALAVHAPDGVFMGLIELDFRLDRLARVELADGRMAAVATTDYDIPVVVVGTLVRP